MVQEYKGESDTSPNIVKCWLYLCADYITCWSCADYIIQMLIKFSFSLAKNINSENCCFQDTSTNRQRHANDQMKFLMKGYTDFTLFEVAFSGFFNPESLSESDSDSEPEELSSVKLDPDSEDLEVLFPLEIIFVFFSVSSESLCLKRMCYF